MACLTSSSWPKLRKLLRARTASWRCPISRANARRSTTRGRGGLILGLTLRHGRAHLYRALLESIGYGVRHIPESLGEAGGAPKRLVAVGGGTKGGLWAQIVSDVTGLPQEIPAVTIGACYGDALLAAQGIGLVPAGTSWATAAEVVRPSDSTRGLYDELYSIYRSLYPATVEQAHALSRIQSNVAD